VHPSAHRQMAGLVEGYVPKDRAIRVLDFGARTSLKQTVTHRTLFDGYDCTFTGVDIKDGNNVDLVMKKPYRIPVRAGSVDVVITGQVFEHVPFMWVSFLEIARVLRPGGLILMTVPSRGHVHSFYDCWRYYPDSMRALAAFARIELVENYTDFPPSRRDSRRHDYRAIDVRNYYWGDTVGVFRKPEGRQPRALSVVREVLVWWANRIGDLEHVPSRPRKDTHDRHPW
jgi:SAM-dependent methyltransferase